MVSLSHDDLLVEFNCGTEIGLPVTPSHFDSVSMQFDDGEIWKRLGFVGGINDRCFGTSIACLDRPDRLIGSKVRRYIHPVFTKLF